MLALLTHCEIINGYSFPLIYLLLMWEMCGFFFFFEIYLFIYLLAVVGVCCCTWAFSSFSSFREQALCFVTAGGLLIVVVSLVAEPGLSGCVGSGAVVPVAGGIFQDQGSNWCPLHCKADS